MADQNQIWKSRLKYFPCKKRGKSPAHNGWQQEATTDRGRVAEWLTQGYNLGIACGADSNVFVLDIDPDKGGWNSLARLEKEIGSLPETYRVKTGGGGEHRYFLFPALALGNAVSFLPGLDIRTTGGLVVAPGSTHDTGNLYVVKSDVEPIAMPQSWIEKIQQLQDKAARQKSSQEKTGSRPRVSEGSRNDTIFKKACAIRDDFTFEEALELCHTFNKRCDPPLPDSEVETAVQSAYGYSKSEPNTFDSTDQALAKMIVDERGDVIRWLQDDESWRVYRNGLWVEDRGGPIAIAAELFRQKDAELAELLGEPGKKLHARLYSKNAVASALYFVPAAVGIFTKDLDPDPWLLGLPAEKALDLRTGEIRGARPQDLITKQLTVAPKDGCPRWLQCLEEWFPGDRGTQEYLQRYVGYSLTNSSREEQVSFFYGPGGAGKGTFIEVLESIFGPYYYNLTVSALLEDTYEDRKLNHLAELCGRRLAVCNEGAKSKKLDSRQLKALTGGGSVTGRRLMHQPITFPITSKILIVANDRPNLELDDAMKQRVHIVPFNQQFRGTEKDNKGLKEELKNPANLAGILQWAVVGCLEWQKSGLMPPSTVVDCTEQYFQETDFMERFLQDCTVPELGSFTPTKVLFSTFERWCREEREENPYRHLNEFVPEVERRRSRDPKVRKERLTINGTKYSGLTNLKLNDIWKKEQQDERIF